MHILFARIGEFYSQEPQFRQLPQRFRNGTRETVQVQVQAHQIGQISEVTRNRPTNVVTV